ALVLAESRELAQDALVAISVEIEPLPPVLNRRAALQGAVSLFGDDGNRACTFRATKGDAAAAFAASRRVVQGSFRVHRMTALPMEPRALMAEWDEAAGRLTVSGAAKLPFFNRRALASMMSLPETSVDYVEYDVGGGFGARGEFYPED